MKLAPVLAEYLITNKRLDLPGLGTFLLDPLVITDYEQTKHGKPENMAGVSFENNPGIKEEKELIEFISSRTGKMKALASADLDSYLQLAQQFLNIGKPFLVEGIGSLVKTQSGRLAFAADELTQEKIKEYSHREITATSSSEESFSRFESENKKMKWRKPVVFGLIIVGILLAIWGGYTVYRKTSGKKTTPVTEDKKDKVIPLVSIPDTTHQVITDSVTNAVQVGDSGNFKFVIEEADEKRAFERYTKLKTYQWNIHMETHDSLRYKLFVMIRAAVSDTSRMIDSLTALNGRRVYIEY
ncbi:MAG TPA: hypothetical protein VLJ68_03605 [Chitinophagaceae bacterium]|nr:hypothetical protein [Chitinophagaceae bacterium]